MNRKGKANMDLCKSLAQMGYYVGTGSETLVLVPKFFDSVNTTDDVIKFLGYYQNDSIKMFNIKGDEIDRISVDNILLNKIPNKIRVSIPIKEGKKNYKAWFAKLLVLQNFLFNKVENSFELEVHDKDFYSAGVVDIQTIKYMEFIPKKHILIETNEKDYVLGNELGIRETYRIDGKVIYAKPLIQKLHFDWLINDKIIKLDEYERAIDNYCNRIIEQEEAEYIEAPDFFNDIPLSAYQMLCKMYNNVDNKITDWLVNKINKAFGYAFKDIEAFLDFIDAKRDKKLDKDLYFLDNRSLIELIKTMYREAPTESLDDTYFGNSIYFEDTAYDAASDILDNSDEE